MGHASEKNEILAGWAETLAIHGAEPAIFSSAGIVERSFADIEREAGEWQARLVEFPPGSVLALALPNHAAWPALVLAAFRQELIPLPIPADTPEELYSFCGPAGRVFPSAGRICIEPLNFSPAPWPGLPPEFLKLTSGTTSRPRAVLFTSKQLAADCRNICRTMGLSAADRNFGVIPFSHSYGFSNLITPLLLAGIPLVGAADPFPRAILEGLERSPATVLPGVPALFAALTRLADAELPERVRLCLSAGAPLAETTARAFREKFGRPVHSFYGSSECGGICFDRDGILRRGFVGEAMDGVEIRGGETIEVRSTAVASGYFPPDAALRGGAFYPADLLERDPEGWRIVGRATEVINVAGRKVNPGEIEAGLLRVPGVRDCVVFGVERETTSVIYAVVVGDHSEERLRRHCAQFLPAWQVPRQIFCEPEIPRTDRGKVNRRELAETYFPK